MIEVNSSNFEMESEKKFSNQDIALSIIDEIFFKSFQNMITEEERSTTNVLIVNNSNLYNHDIAICESFSNKDETKDVVLDVINEIFDNVIENIERKENFKENYELISLQNKLETLKNGFLDIESHLELSRPIEENLSNLQRNLHSIYKTLFGVEHNYKLLGDFFDSIKELPEIKSKNANQNLVLIDLNESIRTRNQKRSTTLLKENKKLENLPIVLIEDNNEENNKKNKKVKKDDDYEPLAFEEEYSESGDFPKFTGKKRRAKNELKKTTTGKKLKRDMLKEMKEFTKMAQNSIEYDVFF